MSIFKRRTLKPSQLEALRKLEEEKVDVGRVSRASNCSNSDFFIVLGAYSASVNACYHRLFLQVLYCKDSIAIVEGLNNDADVGTLLSFSSGAVG